MNTARDFLGREIKINDICVYPVRRGSKLWVCKITVREITNEVDGSFRVKGVRGDGYVISIKNLDTMTIAGRDCMVPFMEES
jgi:hypothetical protein